METRRARREAEGRQLRQAVARLDEQLATRPDDLKLLEVRAKAAERLADYADAAIVWQRLVKVARSAGDRPQEARACLQTGVCLSWSGQPNKGVGFLQRAIAAFELLRDAPNTARSRLENARHHASQGDDAKARPLLELAIPGLEAAELWEDAGWAHRELSRILVESGGPESGLEESRLAVEITAKSKVRGALGERLAHLASLHHAMGSVAKARTYYERALPYLKERRTSPRLLATYEALVAISRLDEDLVGEERWLTEAILCVDLTSNEAAQASLRTALAAVIARRDHTRSQHLLELAIERFHRGGNPRGAAGAYRQLGELLCPRDREAARSAWSRAIDFLRMIGDDSGADEVAALSSAAGA